MPDSWFDKWLGKPLEARQRDGRAKDALAGVDRYDRQDAERIGKEMRDFRIAKDKLCEVVGTGAHLFDDAFFGFFKADDSLRPQEDMDPHYLLNHRVASEVEKMPERERLRTWTVGDLVGAAAAAVDIEPDLEVLADRAKSEMSEAERLAKELSRLMDQLMQEESDLVDLEKELADLLDSLDDLDLDDLPDLDPNDLPDPDDLTDPGVDGVPVGPEPQDSPGDGDDQDGDGEGQGEGEEGSEAGQGEGDGPGTGKQGPENTPAESDQDGDGDEPADGDGDGEGQGSDDSPGQRRRKRLQKAVQRARDRLEADKEKAEKTAAALQDAIDKAARKAIAAIRQGMATAANNAEQSNMAARAWGVDPGQLQRMSAAERIKLADRIRRIEGFEELTDLIGKLDRLAAAEKMKVTYHSFEEIYDVSVGDDLAHVLPSELVSLTNPTLKLDFYRKFNDRQLLEYQMRGQEKLGKGPVFFAMDNSGSMSGQPERLAKALGIAMLHVCKEADRGFMGCHFSSQHQCELFDFTDHKNGYDVYRVLDFAEKFFNGGTDFRPPLAQGLRFLQEEFDRTGMTRADIVFVTDGMAPLDDEFIRHFVAELDRMDATCYGLAIGCRATSKPLADFCNGGVMEVTDFLSGNDVKFILSGMQRI